MRWGRSCAYGIILNATIYVAINRCTVKWQEHERGFLYKTSEIGSVIDAGNKSVMRYLDVCSRSLLERLEDLWFAPKPFESTRLYERLGVLLVKRYAPTGGDFVNRRYGITIVDIHGTLVSLIKFERMTRRLEAIHVIVFLGFLTFSLWRAVTRRTTFLDFGFATLVYILLILSPAMLQRYNRLRVYAAIRHLATRQRR